MKLIFLTIIGFVFCSNHLDNDLKKSDAAECEIRITAFDLLGALKSERIPIEGVLIKIKSNNSRVWKNKGLTNVNGELDFSLTFDKNDELLYRFRAQRDEYENTTKLLFIGDYAGAELPIQYLLLKEKDQEELANMIRADISSDDYDEARDKLNIFKNAYPDYDTTKFAKIAFLEKLLRDTISPWIDGSDGGFSTAFSKSKSTFSSMDVFELEWADHPQISPNANWIVYERKGMNIMKDRRQSRLWLINSDGSGHQPLTNNEVDESNARWSPNGDRIAFIASTDQGAELYVYWLGTGRRDRISKLSASPNGLSWSPDGEWIAFSMFVEGSELSLVNPHKKPTGANWADPPRVTTRIKHEADGVDYMKPGFTHLFIISTEDGTARQITKGDRNYHGIPVWTKDGTSLLLSTNLNENWAYDFRNTEIYRIDVTSGETTALTDRKGPDNGIALSPDGNTIAYLGNDDKMKTYQVNHLYTMQVDGSNKKMIDLRLDRNISNLHWDAEGNGIYFQYADRGNTKIGYTDLAGNMKKVTEEVGGTVVAGPYYSGNYSLADNDVIVFTHSEPDRPADIALIHKGSDRKRLLTDLNQDLLANRKLGKVKEIWYKSSVDKLDIQGWIVFPPDFIADQKYPLLVENHSGITSGYDGNFSPEIQLYASAGYIVFYPNPRGSIGYGEAFGNLSHNNFPGDGYHDVMDGIDAVIAKGYIAEDQLFVTGGSAGGIMSAWMVGKNNRFRAAAIIKPMMNWISQTSTPDNYYGYFYYNYPGQPWENPEYYRKFSPISIVDDIQTPTLIMVGTSEMSTPLSEAEQLYKAFKLHQIETALVVVPDAYHLITNRPTHLISKIEYILAWFERYRSER